MHNGPVSQLAWRNQQGHLHQMETHLILDSKTHSQSPNPWNIIHTHTKLTCLLTLFYIHLRISLSYLINQQNVEHIFLWYPKLLDTMLKFVSLYILIHKNHEAISVYIYTKHNHNTQHLKQTTLKCREQMFRWH